MASNILPQILFMIPAQAAPKKLAFTASVSRRHSGGQLVSGVSTGCCKFRARRCRYVVRAEENGGGVVKDEETGENVDEEEYLETDGDEVLSDKKPPFQPRVKLGDIMGILNKKAIEASDEARPIPDIRTGDIVEVKLEIPEIRKRLSTYKGIVISRQNAGIHTTIRIRRVIAGVGVEIVLPIYSPSIKEIKVVKHRKVRRAKLYYLRDKLPRFSTFK